MTFSGARRAYPRASLRKGDLAPPDWDMQMQTQGDQSQPNPTRIPKAKRDVATGKASRARACPPNHTSRPPCPQVSASQGETECA